MRREIGEKMRSARTQGGFAAARVIIALTASTGLTTAVVGPMAYQAHLAQERQARRTEQPDRDRPTATKPDNPPDPNVLPEREVRSSTTTAPQPSSRSGATAGSTARRGGAVQRRATRWDTPSTTTSTTTSSSTTTSTTSTTVKGDCGRGNDGEVRPDCPGAG
ncbi:MAG: hypothetical protein ACKOYM_03945 [Actinomycetes bacterium]